nr:M67 family metallopeptidase [Croceibacterium sp. D39]
MERLLAEAQAAAPHEACGLLLGRGMHIETAVPARNVHPRPATRFEIDPQALVDAHRAARAGGPEVLGYYHSHPAGTAEPSPTDVASAANDGKIWAIVANGTVRFWRAGDGAFGELPTGLHNG